MTVQPTPSTGVQQGVSGHSTPVNYLSAFQRLGPQIYFYHPTMDNATNGNAETTTTKTATEPDLIVICSWMAASARHIVKYTNPYFSRYPSVPVLLVRSSQRDVMLKPDRHQLEEMKPAVSAVQSVFGSLNAEPKVLMHVFSNGGSWSAGMLTTAYLEATGGLAFPISALILDSCPSFPHMRASYRALSAILPKFFVIRIIGSIIIWIWILIFRIINELHITENLILRVRRFLNDPAGPFIKGGVPRTYICSKTDAMVPLDDVSQHAEDARKVLRQSGLDEAEARNRVKFEEFEGSPHVGHLMVDKDRYWKIVEQVWENGMKVMSENAANWRAKALNKQT